MPWLSLGHKMDSPACPPNNVGCLYCRPGLARKVPVPDYPPPRRPERGRPAILCRAVFFGSIVLTVVLLAGCAAISPPVAAVSDATALVTRAAPTSVRSTARPTIVTPTESRRTPDP